MQSVSFSPNINFIFTVCFATLFTFSAAFSSGARYATTGFCERLPPSRIIFTALCSHSTGALAPFNSFPDHANSLLFYFWFVEWSSVMRIYLMESGFFSWLMTSWGFNHIFKTLLISKIYCLAFCFHSLSLNLTPMIQGRTYQDYSSLHALTPSSN